MGKLKKNTYTVKIYLFNQRFAKIYTLFLNSFEVNAH